jgi:hypothetical protein
LSFLPVAATLGEELPGGRRMTDDQKSPAQNPTTTETTSEQDHVSSSSGGMTMVTIYICAAIGGVIAAIADIVQKEQASAVMKLTTVSARHLELAVPPLYVFAIVVFLGLLLCFVFQPGNRRAGFAVGAGVIASIMTVTPYRPLQTGQPAETENTTYLLPGNGFQVATTDIGRMMLAMSLTDIAVFPVKNDLAVPVEVKMSFYDRNGQQAYEQSRAIAAGQTGIFEFSAKANQGQIKGEFFIEVAGERSTYVDASGDAPYQSTELLLTQAVPTFAQAQINTQALETYSATTGTAPRTANDAEIRQIYNKPTGFFNQLQQKLLTPKKW